MFEFKFLDSETNKENDHTDEQPYSEFKWFAAKEVHPELEFLKEVRNADFISLLKCGENVVLKHIPSKAASLLTEKVKDCPLFKAEQDDSDLLTGVYEGGLKIWECTYDLANYLTEQQIKLKAKTVLDLGCGAGVLGILAFSNGASVYFQDYNEEILRYITIPNVYLNTAGSSEENKILDRCKFYAGDWKSFLAVTEQDFLTDDKKFDYIFTCETIYNPSNYEKLHTVFKDRLKQDGVIYLAAKTHYFGVGGGLRLFEDYMTKEKVFQFSTRWKCSDGLQREILEIIFRKST